MDDRESMFGGFWTENKIEIFIKYLKAYLEIMKMQNFKLIYFDGFAGSGYIKTKSNSLIEGVASRVLSIGAPKEFDVYYFVELNPEKSEELSRMLKTKYHTKTNKIYVEQSDCNEKLINLCDYLKKNSNRRALVFLDPKGMQLKFKSLEGFKNQGVDLWLLVPTGMGVNRLLSKDGKNISEEFIKKLSDFLDMEPEEIMRFFYKEKINQTLFGEESELIKENAINNSIELIKSKLKDIFENVSKPFPMKNSKNSIMYHFIFASNNKTGLKIANDIIGKQMDMN